MCSVRRFHLHRFPPGGTNTTCDCCQCVFVRVGTNADFLPAVVGVFLWPLISSHDVGLWLKPVLQKLDFGVGEFLQKVKENHGNSDQAQCSSKTTQTQKQESCLRTWRRVDSKLKTVRRNRMY